MAFIKGTKQFPQVGLGAGTHTPSRPATCPPCHLPCLTDRVPLRSHPTACSPCPGLLTASCVCPPPCLPDCCSAGSATRWSRSSTPRACPM